ncbi:hypothetical protein EVAR_11642_1 [Eumeta japonica]|uniref:Uncharacterized protein n=1 Tax=Eumeta variegata TaxID=151549 RepID=A0A4C1WXI2_EUMVA|nr:hypothetical protein EVAR_11642_1 [Eumeta japonica]
MSSPVRHVYALFIHNKKSTRRTPTWESSYTAYGLKTDTKAIVRRRARLFKVDVADKPPGRRGAAGRHAGAGGAARPESLKLYPAATSNVPSGKLVFAMCRFVPLIY